MNMQRVMDMHFMQLVICHATYVVTVLKHALNFVGLFSAPDGKKTTVSHM